MSNVIAIDVGYSHVKAVSHEGRVVIPSVVAPARELSLSDFAQKTGYAVSIKRPDSPLQKYFVGELAIKEGQGATFTTDREKHRHPNHDILILTVAKLLGAEPGATLVAGLPIAYYKSQKEELKQHLEQLEAEVATGSGDPKLIKFGKVIVYPQGAGALLKAPLLSNSGTVLLVDVGQKTTDYVTAEIVNDVVRPIASLCGSVETAVSSVYDAFAVEFQALTGSPISPVRVIEIVRGNGTVVFNGKEYDFRPVIKTIKESVARSIYDQVQAALGERFSFLSRIYLAGGGAVALPLSDFFRGAISIPEPQWANAQGFLSIV
ncbi:MAG: ParM/StbA family protein [Bacillota bacterium]